LLDAFKDHKLERVGIRLCVEGFKPEPFGLEGTKAFFAVLRRGLLRGRESLGVARIEPAKDLHRNETVDSRLLIERDDFEGGRSFGVDEVRAGRH